MKNGRFKKIEFLNCHWKIDSSDQSNSVSGPSSADVVKVLNSTTRLLDLTIFSNVSAVKVDGCKIDVVGTYSEITAEGIEKVSIRNSRINRISNLTVVDLEELKFETSHLNYISTHAFRFSEIGEVTFKQTKIRELSLRCFEKFQTTSLSFDFCWVGTISSELFPYVTMKQFIVNNTHVGVIEKNSFINYSAEKIEILNSKINEIKTSPFLDAEVIDLQIFSGFVYTIKVIFVKKKTTALSIGVSTISFNYTSFALKNFC